MRMLEPLWRAQRQLVSIFKGVKRIHEGMASVREALGRIEVRQCQSKDSPEFAENEFKVYSQWGEDGLIQFLIRHVKIPRPIFIEFGVQDYTEANTRFLLVNNNWSGVVIDGDEANIARIRQDSIYWRHNLKAVNAFITRENINDLIKAEGLSGPIGLLSVDIDGNDYWVWEAISVVEPAIVVVEFNARFGPQRAVTVPYDPGFIRERAHHSCIYYGASLTALATLGQRKGYALVGINQAANNAFFVRKELLVSPLRSVLAADVWKPGQFRESRSENGEPAFLNADEEQQLLSKLPLIEIPS